MAQVTFQGRLVIPDSDVNTFEIPLNQDVHIQLTDNRDVILHAIYVSNPNPVFITVEMKPEEPVTSKKLNFKASFENNVTPVPFFPPLGPYPLGRIYVKATAPETADKPIYIAFQYLEIEEV